MYFLLSFLSSEAHEKQKIKIRDHQFINPFNPLVNKGFRPQASVIFGLNSPSQLFIEYHWLAFLNQVRKNLSVPEILFKQNI